MIGAYYTGADAYLDEQRDPRKSLGGYVSSSLVPNGSLNNVFGDVSELSLATPLNVVRGIVLQNNTGADINNLRLWLGYPTDPMYLLEVAVVAVSQDECNHYFLEKLPNENSSPYVGNFVSADGESNAIVIGSVTNSGYVGVWLRSTINDQGQRACDTLFSNFENNITVPKQQTISLVLDWS